MTKHKAEKTLEGPIAINTKGVGFFDIGEKRGASKVSIEIQPKNVNRAFNGDIVLISLLGKKIKNRPQGKVEKIIKRAKDEFVGTIDKHDGKIYVIPDDRRMYVDIFLPKEKSVQKNIKVLVKVINWSIMQGKMIKVIGQKGENNAEMESIVLEKGFRIEFPNAVELEAERIHKSYKASFAEEIKKRRDMLGTTTFTIDPFDAKDFDDAISFKDLGDNKYEIGIHIADVSHFVTPGTELDREAEKRGLSVYLVDRTIPMLPEILSNDFCSLNPDEDKLTFSAIFTMTGDEKVEGDSAHVSREPV